jgi:hypothetical protein
MTGSNCNVGRPWIKQFPGQGVRFYECALECPAITLIAALGDPFIHDRKGALAPFGGAKGIKRFKIALLIKK